MNTNTLTPDLLHKMDAYWRAANYLSVGQIYLYDNPLLKRPLTLADVKHMLLGYWGTTPGQNFIYVQGRACRRAYQADAHVCGDAGRRRQRLAASDDVDCTRCDPLA
jgi:xylulose-5-phosphate/fructose-6-phosphate phosphoketolase